MWKETLCQGPRPRAGRLLPSGPGARPGNGQDLRGLGGSTQPRPRASAPGQTPRGLWGSWPCGLPIRALPRLSRSPIFLLQVRVPRLTEEGQEPPLQLAGWPVCSEACLLPGSVLAFLSCQPELARPRACWTPRGELDSAPLKSWIGTRPPEGRQPVNQAQLLSMLPRPRPGALGFPLIAASSRHAGA